MRVVGSIRPSLLFRASATSSASSRASASPCGPATCALTAGPPSPLRDAPQLIPAETTIAPDRARATGNAPERREATTPTLPRAGSRRSTRRRELSTTSSVPDGSSSTDVGSTRVSGVAGACRTATEPSPEVELPARAVTGRATATRIARRKSRVAACGRDEAAGSGRRHADGSGEESWGDRARHRPRPSCCRRGHGLDVRDTTGAAADAAHAHAGSRTSGTTSRRIMAPPPAERDALAASRATTSGGSRGPGNLRGDGAGHAARAVVAAA